MFVLRIRKSSDEKGPANVHYRVAGESIPCRVQIYRPSIITVDPQSP
jgi:hypothetical protein